MRGTVEFETMLDGTAITVRPENSTATDNSSSEHTPLRTRAVAGQHRVAVISDYVITTGLERAGRHSAAPAASSFQRLRNVRPAVHRAARHEQLPDRSPNTHRATAKQDTGP